MFERADVDLERTNQDERVLQVLFNIYVRAYLSIFAGNLINPPRRVLLRYKIARRRRTHGNRV